ncbi:MAG: YajQ family cyclic di-GMP-binding protein, partial [Actinobacteria bacterium]|nr:YajQ family cyclic di-GMP-binding protein [Actinomycetota bacterium]
MAKDNSFDIVSEVNLQEVDNAVNQANKEIATRYDFKGSKSNLTWDKAQGMIVIDADDDFKLNSVKDILHTKIIRRGIDIKALDYGKVEQAAGGMVRQQARVQQGIPEEKAREISKYLRSSKLKIQVQIEGPKVRVSGKSRDELQQAIG